jgi:hypothetical protein
VQVLVVFFGDRKWMWARPSALLDFEECLESKEAEAEAMIRARRCAQPAVFRRALQVGLPMQPAVFRRALQVGVCAIQSGGQSVCLALCAAPDR